MIENETTHRAPRRQGGTGTLAGTRARPARLGRYPLLADFFAAAAGVGALLAVVHLVFGAFFLAEAADVGAVAQQALGAFRAAGHEAGRQGADVGAVAVKLNAAGHHLHVVFLQAGGGAVFAGCHAGGQGLEQALVLLVHGDWV